MTKSLQVSSNSGTAISTTDGYTGVVAYSMNIGVALLANEANVKTKYYESGTFSLLTVVISASTTGSTSTVIILKNSDVSGNQTLSIGAAATGTFTDSTNTDAVVSGDLWYMKWGSVSSGSATCSSINIVFDAASNTSTVLGFNRSAGFGLNPVVGTTQIMNLPGSSLQATGNEAFAQDKIKTAGTFKNMYVYVSTNTKVTNTTVGSRVNGSTGALTVSCTASTTGIFEDSSNSDTIASGDLLSWFITG